MAAKIKADVLQALDAWKAGKPVRSIELGHVQRMTHSEEHLQSYPNTRPQIDLTKRVSVDQECAHAYLFKILEFYTRFPLPETYESFINECRRFPALVIAGHEEITAVERVAAESLAWKALLLGWRRAIDGFPDAHYIEVTNPAAVSAT